MIDTNSTRGNETMVKKKTKAKRDMMVPVGISIPVSVRVLLDDVTANDVRNRSEIVVSILRPGLETLRRSQKRTKRGTG